jgi:hypothetical protein
VVSKKPFPKSSILYLYYYPCLQALHAAEESVKADPTVAKAWCRLGDACRALLPFVAFAGSACS